jgi:hypothetical protein
MVALALAALAMGGCGSEEPLILHSMGLRPIPVDTTLPNEIAESEFAAFGLVMPRDLRLKKRSHESLVAVGSGMDFDAVSDYFRERLEGGEVTAAPMRTLFRGTTVKGQPDRHVRVDVLKIFRGVKVIVYNHTPSKPTYPLDVSEEERWRRVGLTPDGKVLEEYAQ